jgi:hypothetical protein
LALLELSLLVMAICVAEKQSAQYGATADPFLYVNTQYNLGIDGVMVVIGSYSKGTLLQESSNEQLCAARERMKRFRILNEIFKNFEVYHDLHYKARKNKVFITCRPRLTELNEIG